MNRVVLAIACLALHVAAPPAHSRSVDRAQRADPNLEPLDPGGHISYFIADGIPHYGYRPGDTELAIWALQEWERNSSSTVQFERTNEESGGLIRIYWVPAGPTSIGRTQRFMSGRRVRAMVSINPNAERAEPLGAMVKADPLLRDTIVYLTCLHEIGHALGLAHSSNWNDVMREGEATTNIARFQRYRRVLKIRQDISTTQWLSMRDIAALKSLYSH
jgi:hypothetical protein